MRRVFDSRKETSFLEAELESAEFGGEDGDDCQCLGWREDDGVYAVNNSIRAELDIDVSEDR